MDYSRVSTKYRTTMVDQPLRQLDCRHGSAPKEWVLKLQTGFVCEIERASPKQPVVTRSGDINFRHLKLAQVFQK